jgi:hypothetical protein
MNAHGSERRQKAVATQRRRGLGAFLGVLLASVKRAEVEGTGR